MSAEEAVTRRLQLRSKELRGVRSQKGQDAKEGSAAPGSPVLRISLFRRFPKGVRNGFEASRRENVAPPKFLLVVYNKALY
jgi:hypothetical protein